MPRVIVASSLCDQFTGGNSEIEVAAADLRQMVAELDRRFPGMGEYVRTRMSIVVDSRVHHAWTAPLEPETEVYLIPRIAGGCAS